MSNKLIIGYEIKSDGRLYIDFAAENNTHINYSELLTVLTASLSMTIRAAGEKSHKTEGEIFREVLAHLESEFINPDSFKDLSVIR